MMTAMTTRVAANDVQGWYGRRGFAVAEDLDRLQGPTSGCATLPLAIEASHRSAYDLSDDHQRAEAYRVVLMEALTQDDLASWLDRDELVRVWPDLYLPREIRAAWQARHPALAARGAGPTVQQP
jgi:hypothetical protein